MNSIVIAASGGGLGNRLNCIFTAIALHIHTNLPLIIHWNPTQDFECSVEDLFDISSIVTCIDHYPFYPFVSKETSIGEYILIAAFYSGHPQPYVDVITTESITTQIEKINTYKKTYHFAVHGPQMYTFGISTREIGMKFFELFRPKDFILQQVSNSIKTFQPQNGIHMRLTDKIQINNYNTDNFTNDLLKLLLHNTNTFICSDDNEYEQKAASIIPNSFHILKTNSISFLDPTNNNSIVRNNTTCVPAFIDFLLFTYCPYKYGINSDESTSTFFSCAKFLQESFQSFIDNYQ